MADKWNGKHGVEVDIDKLIAERGEKDPEFKEAYADAREARLTARALVELREANGLNQNKVAKRMRTTQPAISKMEKPGYLESTLGTLQRYVNAAGTGLLLRLQPGKPMEASISKGSSARASEFKTVKGKRVGTSALLKRKR